MYLLAINTATTNQINDAFQVVKKLPLDLIGQISKINEITKGIIIVISGFIFWLNFFMYKKESLNKKEKNKISKTEPIIPASLKIWR